MRHRPETTLFYQVIREYWPEFQAELASQEKYLPAYSTKEFDEYLKCGFDFFIFVPPICTLVDSPAYRNNVFILPEQARA